MIKVTIEFWPHGKQKEKKKIGHAFIVNTGQGTEIRGEYAFGLWGAAKKTWRTGKVGDFPRKSKNVWYLLKKVLEEI